MSPLVEEPVAVFLTIIAVILIAPLLLSQLHLPGIIGLILGGILIGPHGLHLLTTDHTIEVLAMVGLNYLMFSAGLEIDLQQFARVRSRSVIFGVLTFTIPLGTGALLGRAVLDMEWVAALLLGSIFASHTLVAFPIVSRLSIARNEAIAVTIGATVFTDVGALLVLALIAGLQNGHAARSFLLLLPMSVAYAAFVLLAVPKLGKLFVRRFSSHAVEFQFVLVVLFVAAELAELIGLHAIIGAFLAGLAINATLPRRSTVIGQVLFVGESLFIPMFLLYVGMLTDPLAIVTDIQALLTGVLLTVTVYVTKFIAAWITARILHYNRNELFTAWGLSQAQAAATLTAVLIGVELGIFSQSIFAGAILMILATTITSPMLVQKYGRRLCVPVAAKAPLKLLERILVPVANPETQEHLLALATILAAQGRGQVISLRVVSARNGQRSPAPLRPAPEAAGTESGAMAQLLVRIDTSIAKGILHTAIEQHASLLIMGWRGKPTFSQSIFGTVLDEVVWEARVPVLVGRIGMPLSTVQRAVLVIPPNSLDVRLTGETLDIVTAVVDALHIELLMLVAEGYRPALEGELDNRQIAASLDELHAAAVIEQVAETVNEDDLLMVLTSGSTARFRSSLGYLPEQFAELSAGSMITIHFPQEQ